MEQGCLHPSVTFASGTLVFLGSLVTMPLENIFGLFTAEHMVSFCMLICIAVAYIAIAWNRIFIYLFFFVSAIWISVVQLQSSWYCTMPFFKLFFGSCHLNNICCHQGVVSVCLFFFSKVHLMFNNFPCIQQARISTYKNLKIFVCSDF